MKKYLWLAGLLVMTISTSGLALDQHTLPFGAMYLHNYDSVSVSKLANEMCFNLFLEYDPIDNADIELLNHYGIQAARGGKIGWGQAEAPMAYSWSNYAEIDVAFPYPNDEVRMVPFQGDTTTDPGMWTSHRNNENRRDTLSGISTYLDRFNDGKAKSHVIFNAEYFYDFPGPGRINYQTDIYMKIDSRDSIPGDSLTDIVAYVYWKLSTTYSGPMDTIRVGTIRAGDFASDNTIQKISLPDIQLPTDDAKYVTLDIIATGKREVSVNKVVISDLFGRNLIENHAYDDVIQDKFREYADNGTLENAIYGWFLMDEPHYSNLKPFGYIYNLMHSDSVNTNWVPVTYFDKYSDLNGSYLKLVGTRFVLNDIYPFWLDSPYAGDEFQLYRLGYLHDMLSICRSKIDSMNALGDTTEFWLAPQAFADNSNWRFPTPSELSCMTYMGLTWGCRGILYWYYDNSTFTNSCGILTSNHEPTPLYDQIRNMIGPYIKAIDSTYMGLRWLRAFPLKLCGYHPPEAFVSWVQDLNYGYPLPADLGWYHVGEFDGPPTDPTKYFMLVNRRCSRGPNDSREAYPARVCIWLNSDNLALGDYVYICEVSSGKRTYTTIIDEQLMAFTLLKPLKAGSGTLYRVKRTQRHDLVGRIDTDIAYQGVIDITGDVTIPRGETLRIEGPAEITVTDNYTIMLEPGAAFIAEGFDSNLVTITPAKKEWGGIAMESGSSIYLDYCQLNGDFKGIEANAENMISIKNSIFTNTVDLIDAVGSISVRIDSCIFQGSSISGITLSYPESVWINGNQFIDNGLYAMCIVGPAKCCTVQFNQISEPQEYGIKYFGSEVDAVFSENQINGYREYGDTPVAGIYADSDPKEGDPLVTITGGNINFFDVGIQLLNTVEGTLVGSGVHCDSNYKYGIVIDKAYADIMGMGEPGGPNTFNYNGIDGLYATSGSGIIRKNHFDYNDYAGGEVFDCYQVFGDSLDEGDNSIGDGSTYGLLAYGEPIMAIMNWWGTDEGSEIKDKVTELVSYVITNT